MCLYLKGLKVGIVLDDLELVIDHRLYVSLLRFIILSQYVMLDRYQFTSPQKGSYTFHRLKLSSLHHFLIHWQFGIAADET